MTKKRTQTDKTALDVAFPKEHVENETETSSLNDVLNEYFKK